VIDGGQATSELEPTGGLRQYLDVLRRRKWIALGVLVVAIGSAAVFTALQPTKYKSTSKIVIGQGSSLPQLQFGNTLQPFVATMGDLIESHVVAQRVVRNLGLSLSPESLLSKTSVSINPETAVLKLSVTDRSKERARLLNAEIGRVFAETVTAQFGQGAPSTRGATAQAPLTARVFDPAHVLPRKVQPRPVRNLALAGLLGGILALLSAFLREHFDRRLRTREDVERSFGLPVIGQVPFRRLGRREQRRVVWERFGEIAESYRGLRANLQYLAVRRPVRTILVTSAAPQQGKTTVTANLAVAIARSGANTMIVEGDLRRPGLTEAFGLEPRAVGLTSVLVGVAESDLGIRELALPGESGAGELGRVSLLPSGPLPPNPSELLSSVQMSELLDGLAAENDYVLVDSPPLLLVSDALELARLVDGVILVVRRNRARTDEAKELRSLLERLEINLLGVVFTDIVPLGSYGTYGRPVSSDDELSGPEVERVVDRNGDPARRQPRRRGRSRLRAGRDL
jgi:tyrosine-protein kinase